MSKIAPEKSTSGSVNESVEQGAEETIVATLVHQKPTYTKLLVEEPSLTASVAIVEDLPLDSRHHQATTTSLAVVTRVTA